MRWLFLKITDISEIEYKAVYASLTPSRKRHIDSMKQTDDRLRSLAAEYLVKELLNELDVKNAKLETGENGKPYLVGSDLFVSISHSYEGVVCVVDKNRIGIDIEKIREVPHSLINYTCTDQEKEYVLGGEENHTFKRFFEVWTAKEALLKKTGIGIKEAMEINTLLTSKKVFYRENYIITII